jgi:hypothetical protein
MFTSQKNDKKYISKQKDYIWPPEYLNADSGG